ncbi:MAG: D-TA family PLP-dependent enzyme [Kiloniellaceae bacterium]
MNLADISTPAVIVDLNVARRNVEAFQSYMTEHGFRARPHIKTHKLPRLAEMQLTAGAAGITCQKVSEAEAMAAGSASIRDILITYNILGAEKLARLKDLAGKVTLAVVADNARTIDGLSQAFATAPRPLRVLVECNTGADRCGVTSPAAALDLARRIDGAAGLTFGGLMTYPPTGGGAQVQAFMTEAKGLIEAAGLEVGTITSGGTPDMWRAHEAPVVTEYRAGTYIYNDRSLVARGVCGWQDCALAVYATVVSVPAKNRAIVDAGSKTLTSDLLGLKGHGHVIGRDDIAIDQLSEEHGRLVAEGPIDLAVGDKLRIVPNHACVVTNMVDTVYVTSGDGDYQAWPVVARGKIY